MNATLLYIAPLLHIVYAIYHFIITKNTMKQAYRLWAMAVLCMATFTFTSCNNDDELPVDPNAIERSELIFTQITGPSTLYPHGDHFHGLGGAVEGESQRITFDHEGTATSGGHIDLDPKGFYKLELRVWNYAGNEVQQDYIRDKATADEYKAFLVGGPMVLNAQTTDQSGAIFQPREMQYGDGTAVQGQFETTGIITYITIGESHEGEHAVTYVLRKLNAGVKPNITRSDWNDANYATRFAGTDVLRLSFEIHAEHD